MAPLRGSNLEAVGSLAEDRRNRDRNSSLKRDFEFTASRPCVVVAMAV